MAQSTVTEVPQHFLLPLESALLSVHAARGSGSLPTRHGPGHPGVHLASRHRHTHLSASRAASAWGGLPLARCSVLKGIHWWLRGSRVCLQCGRPEFDPRGGEDPWRRKWQPTPVFLPGKSHGLRSLVDYSSQGCKESNMTEPSTEQRAEITSPQRSLIKGSV